MKFFILALSLFELFFAVQSQAYPEMVRNGYVNCNSCHVSLTGAGLLNDYGREIAREKLAIFKSSDEKDKEHLFAYGALSDAPIAKYLKMGGDVQVVYYLEDRSLYRLARTIFMQGDLEVAYVNKNLTIDASAGIEQPIPGQNVNFISRRHYLQYALTDAYNIRIGKYAPAYGIKNPEHTFITRNQLQFGDDFESYNLELSYITEQWNIFLTGVMGRFDDKQPKRDRGFTAQTAYAPTERLKFGVNTWYGQQENGSNRWVMGGFGMLGLTDKIYASSEVDFQFLSASVSTPRQKGIATTQKVSYEVIEGLWAEVTQEYGKINFLSVPAQAEEYGVEVEIFPRSHFEFNLAYQKIRSGGPSTDFYDYYWLVSHYYF